MAMGAGVNPPLLFAPQPSSRPPHKYVSPGGPLPSHQLWCSFFRRRSSSAGAAAAAAADVSVQSSGDVSVGSQEVRRLEKELKFSPTFADYVKIMESVQLDRDNKPVGGPRRDGISMKRMPVGAREGPKVMTERRDEKQKSVHKAARKGFNGKDGDRNEVFDGAHGALDGVVVKYSVKNRPTGRESANNDNGQEGKFGDVKEVRSSRKAGYNENDERLNSAHRGNSVSRQSRNVESYNVNAKGSVSALVSRNDGTLLSGGSSRMKVDQDNGHSSSSRKNSFTQNHSVNQMHEKMERFKHKLCNSDVADSKNARFFRSDDNHDGLWSSSNAQPTIEVGERNINNGNACQSDESSRIVRRSDHSLVSSPVNSSAKSRRDFSTDYDKPTLDRRVGQAKKFAGYNTIGLNVGADATLHERAEYVWSREDEVVSQKYATRDDWVAEFEDRAAFRTFEVFTDVRNRPRVLRMEMEERIYKLASRLNSSDVNMPEWQFSKMMHAAKIKFSDHSILRVVQILGKFGNWKRVLQVVEWLRSHKRFESYKSRYIYTTVLSVLGKAKRPREALNVFYAMQEQLSSYPDLAAYHCIAVTLGQAGLMKELFDVVDCMRAPPRKTFKLGPLQKWDPRVDPDLIVYNAILNACVQRKQWEGAFWVLQQLKEKAIRPTSTTYGLVMEVMLACGKYNLVYEFFNKVAKSSIPAALNYKVLINAYRKEGKVDEAVQAVEDMERRGVVGSASLYYDLARCLCSAGRCQEGLLQVQKICKVAKKPLVVTYTGLMQACVDSGSTENAKYIFNEMRKFCTPNTVTCNILLKFFVNSGKIQEAMDLFCEILNDAQGARSKVDLVGKVLPDKVMFNTVLEASADSKNWDGFEYAFKQMLHHGFHFDTRRHLRVVLDAYRAGKEQLLDETYYHLLDHGRRPPPPLVAERFLQKLRIDGAAAAASSIARHEVEMRHVPAKSWSDMLARVADQLSSETVVQLVHGIRELVGPSNANCVYRNILCGCSEFLSRVANLDSSEPKATV